MHVLHGPYHLLCDRAFSRHLFVFLLLLPVCALKEERLSALSLVEIYTRTLSELLLLPRT
jgi:hypothetical protein|nr:MAG TPA: hypothetical protein [Caudoviricetes sp.]